MGTVHHLVHCVELWIAGGRFFPPLSRWGLAAPTWFSSIIGVFWPIAPCGHLFPSICKAQEPVCVQTFCPEVTVERFDKRIIRHDDRGAAVLGLA